MGRLQGLTAAFAVVFSIGMAQFASADDKPDNAGLSVVPPRKKTVPDPNRTYLVTVSCTRPRGKAALPLQSSGGFWWQTNTAATHLLAITDSNTNTFPTPDKAKAFIAVYAISGDDTNRTSYVNEACNTKFFLSIRKPLYLLTNALKTDSNVLGPGLKVAEAGLAIASSIWPLFTGLPIPSSPSARFSAVKNSSGPIADFVASFNKGASPTVAYRLYADNYIIDTDYSHVVVNVSPLVSIVGLKDTVVTAEYQDALTQVFKDKLSSGLTSDTVVGPCLSMSNQMRDQQGISSLDIAYGLLFLSVDAGLQREQIIRCLGSRYASQAVQFVKKDWDTNQKFSSEDVATVLPSASLTPPQPNFDRNIKLRLADVMGAMRTYAIIKDDAVTDADKSGLSAFLAPTLSINNKSDQVSLPVAVVTSDAGVKKGAGDQPVSPFKPVLNWQLMDALKKKYTRFGCLYHDNDSLALFLAIPEAPTTQEKYQISDVLPLRLWLNSKQQVSQLQIVFDGADIAAAIKANSTACGPNVLFTGVN
jgi:hypothetical protein